MGDCHHHSIGIRALLVVVSLGQGSAGCAQIETSTQVRVIENPRAEPLQLGAPTGRVSDRGLAVSWTQQLDSLHVQLTAIRQCRTTVHQPVIRIEEVHRKADGTLYWEWGLGGALTAIGILGISRPELLSTAHLDPRGEVERDLSTGYRLAGILGGIGVLLIASAIYDTVRARDSVTHVDAYRPMRGERVACAEPRGPVAGETVELRIDEWSREATTDQGGAVSFRLPAESALPTPPGDDDDDGADPERTIHRGVLRLGPAEAITVDFIAPYGLTYRQPHVGSIEIAPVPPGKRTADRNGPSP